MYTQRLTRAREMQTIRVVITVTTLHTCVRILHCMYIHVPHACTRMYIYFNGGFHLLTKSHCGFLYFHRFCATAVLARFLIGIRALIVTRFDHLVFLS